jgi:hypothetical protein
MSEFDGPIMVTLVQNNDALRAQNAKLVAALEELRDYAASVWFDEAVATDEERELMSRARAALAAARQLQGSGE